MNSNQGLAQGAFYPQNSTANVTQMNQPYRSSTKIQSTYKDPRYPNSMSNLSAFDINLPQEQMRQSMGSSMVMQGPQNSTYIMGGAQFQQHQQHPQQIQSSVNRRLFNQQPSHSTNEVRTENANSSQQRNNQDDSIFSRPFGESLSPSDVNMEDKRGSSEEDRKSGSAGDGTPTQVGDAPQDQSSLLLSQQLPQDLLSYSMYRDNYHGLVSGVTQRAGFSRKGVKKAMDSKDIIIMNIDKETTQHMIFELNKQDIRDLNYNFISQNILVIKFGSSEAADWAIQKYDGEVVNGRKLKANKIMPNGSSIPYRKPTHLFKINEMTDMEENFDQDLQGKSTNGFSMTCNNQGQTPPIQNIQQIGSYQQKAPQVSSQNPQPQQIVTQGSFKSTSPQAQQMNFGYNPQTNFKFQPNPLLQSVSPPPGLMTGPLQSQNCSQYFHPSQYPFQQIPEGHIQDGFQDDQQKMSNFHSQQTSGLIYDPQMMNLNFQTSAGPYQNYQGPQGIHGYQAPINNQESQQQLGNQIYPQAPIVELNPFNNPIPNPQGLNKMDSSKSFDISQQLTSRYTVPNHQSMMQQYQDNSNFDVNLQMMKHSSFDPNSYHENAFGYSSNNSGLLLQKQPSNINLHNQTHNSFTKLSSSVDASQDDEQLFHNIQDQFSGSERSSLYHQTQVLNAQNIVVTGSTRNSDSDNSRNLHMQFKTTQYYQSPLSLQKASLTQRYHDSSMEPVIGGADTPPSYLTPSSNKHLNNSLQYPLSNHQSMNMFRQDFQMQNIRNRNMSHNHQLVEGQINANELNAFGQMPHPQYQMSQKISMTNILHHSFSYANIHPQGGGSNSSQMNDVNMYGMPLVPGYHHHMALSSLNQSMDALSLGAQKRKKVGKEQKSHQTLKYTYSDTSTLSHESQKFELDMERIKKAEDQRTTVMVKNIPNKYDQKTILSEINENHLGKYDFLYLPIDFANQANVGYAFINFVHPIFILDFYKEYHRKKWTRFKSNKICDIKYGRIQGLESLREHFKSSSVMNQSDESVRPRIFEHNNRRDWTQDIKKVVEKYNITTPLEKFLAGAKNLQGGSNTQSLNSTLKIELSHQSEDGAKKRGDVEEQEAEENDTARQWNEEEEKTHNE